MDWTSPIDIYCERVDASFWSEPLNAVSNIAFILAALWAAYEAQRRDVSRFSIWLLITLTFLIGIGSFLFHTFATGWAALADVLPIWLFVASYIVVASALLSGASALRAAFIAAIVIALVVLMAAALTALSNAGGAAARILNQLNGSDQYFPAVLAMLIFSTAALARRHPIRWWFAGATAVFLVSLTFRSVDMHLCPAWPHGTHIFWHLLNGTTLALLLQALIRQTERPTPHEFSR
ncbi:MAG: ceramidase domain-containing protein [Pseudomonadota bacterium]